MTRTISVTTGGSQFRSPVNRQKHRVKMESRCRKWREKRNRRSYEMTVLEDGENDCRAGRVRGRYQGGVEDKDLSDLRVAYHEKREMSRYRKSEEIFTYMGSTNIDLDLRSQCTVRRSELTDCPYNLNHTSFGFRIKRGG